MLVNLYMTPLTGMDILGVSAAVLSVVLFAAYAGLDAALTMLWSAAGQRLAYRLAGDLFLQLQKLSLLFHSKRTVGDALSRLTGDAWSVYAVTEGTLIAPVKHCLTLAFVGVLAWQLDSRLTLLVMIAAPLLAVSVLWFGGRLRQAERAKLEAGAGLAAFVHQILGAPPVLDQLRHGEHPDAVLFRKFEQIRQPRHRAICVHHFADDGRRIQVRQFC